MGHFVCDTPSERLTPLTLSPSNLFDGFQYLFRLSLRTKGLEKRDVRGRVSVYVFVVNPGIPITV